MISIGVLSVQKKKGKLIHIVEKNVGEIKFTIAQISYPDCRFKLTEKMYVKGLTVLVKNILKRRGIENIISEYPGSTSKCVQIPLTDEYMKKCATETAKHMEFTNDTVYLLDKNMAYTDYNLLVEVCLKSKNFCLLTDNRGKAEEMCDELYIEYGVFPDVYNYAHKIPYRAEWIIDFDKMRIKLNSNIIIDGVALEFDIDEINLDFSYLISIYPEIIHYASFKSWTSGKNQLTTGLC